MKCDICRGAGKLASLVCGRCGGSGRLLNFALFDGVAIGLVAAGVAGAIFYVLVVR